MCIRDRAEAATPSVCPRWDAPGDTPRPYELDMYSETNAPAAYTADTIPPTRQPATVFCRLPG
eukprot:8621054-Prorocentrum_lima.AAC.1